MQRSTPLQVQHVHHVLVAALADDRQHAQLVAVVEHGRHVIGEIEIGAVRVAGDDRDGVLVELVALRRVAGCRGLSAAPARLIGLGDLAGLLRAGSQREHATAPRQARRQSSDRSHVHPSPRNRTRDNRCSPGVRIGPCSRAPASLRTIASYHRNLPLQSRNSDESLLRIAAASMTLSAAERQARQRCLDSVDACGHKRRPMPRARSGTVHLTCVVCSE